MGQDLEQAETPNAPPTPLLRLGGTGALLVVLLFSSALDLYFFTGFFSSDDCTYFASAKLLAEQGGYSNLSPGAQRLPIVGWAALVILIGGANIQIVAGSFIFFHQLLNLLTFWLVKRFADTRAALLAAFVLATFPLLIQYSTMLLPDLEQTCGYMLAFLFYTLWRDNLEKRPLLAWLAFLAAGVGVGVSYMIKESALVLLPFFFVAWLTSINRARILFSLVQGAAFAVGFFAMLYGEYLVLSHFAGEPFLRLGWTTKDVQGAVMTSVSKYGADPFERLGWVAKRLNNYVWPHYLKISIGAAMLVFPMLKPRRWALWLLPIWVFAFQVWGTMNFQHYVPPTIQARYFIIIVPFVTAVFAIVALRLYDRMKNWSSNASWRPWLRRVALACVLIPPVFGLYGPDRAAGKMYKSDIVGNTAAAIRKVEQIDPGARIVLSSTLARYLSPLAGADNAPYATARALSDKRFVELIDAARFFYIALDPKRMPGERKWMRDSRLDTFLRNTGSTRINPARKTLTKRLVAYRDALSPGGLSQVKHNGRYYEIAARCVNRSDRPHSRTWALLMELVGMLPPAISKADVNSRTAVTYLVEVRPANPAAATAESAREKDAPPRRLFLDLATSLNERRGDSEKDLLKNWGVGGTAENHAYEDVENGWKLHTNNSSRRYMWLRPRQSRMPRQALTLEPNGRYEIEIDLELEGAIQIDLVLTMSDRDQHGDKPAVETRAWLLDGQNVFGIGTDTRPVAFQPAFKLIGSGSFKINAFRIYLVD